MLSIQRLSTPAKAMVSTSIWWPARRWTGESLSHSITGATMGLNVIDAGKDEYLQQSMTHASHEARRLADAVGWYRGSHACRQPAFFRTVLSRRMDQPHRARAEDLTASFARRGMGLHD